MSRPNNRLCRGEHERRSQDLNVEKKTDLWESRTMVSYLWQSRYLSFTAQSGCQMQELTISASLILPKLSCLALPPLAAYINATVKCNPIVSV